MADTDREEAKGDEEEKKEHLDTDEDDEDDDDEDNDLDEVVSSYHINVFIVWLECHNGFIVGSI